MAKKILYGVAVAAVAGTSYYLMARPTATQAQRLEYAVDSQAKKTYNLSQVEAKMRSANLTVTKYTYKLLLEPGTEYRGFGRIEFTSKMDSNDFWLDLKALRIYSLSINGEAIEGISWTNGKVMLPGVKTGDNVVEILYTNSFANDGLGLHSYTDPEDKEQYLYSQFEPFYCHRCFPSFDQPDLKSAMELHVMAPLDWRVISNEYALIEKVSSGDAAADFPVYEGRNEANSYFLHKFLPTKKISTYLYAVCAGPYEEILRPSNPSGIKLGLYCRKSLFKYLQNEQDKYFDWTIKGFKFYQDFFQTPYPYSKYDQVFVPEFKFGAMENVGCVTYRDQYVFREKVSPSFEAGVAHTFLHEMAHMWFGNLVTMQWWNDLWLNESFADWASYFAQAELDEGRLFPSAWNNFLVRKAWGYRVDQSSTTHPIEARVENTEVCETIFDGISYSKGAAVLKQLLFILGRPIFSNALKNYFTKYGESNTVFDDLITELDEEAKRQKSTFDIWAWADRWIKTAGLNQLEPVYAKDGKGNLTSFSIVQTPAMEQYATLRDHKLNMQFIDTSGKQGELQQIQILEQAATDFPNLVGKPAPACVLLNVGDEGFCKIIPDADSIAWFKTNLQSIPETLTRQLIWRALWDMVRDYKLSAVEFIELVLTHIPHETDGDLANSVLIFLPGAFSFIPGGDFKDGLRHQTWEMLLSKVKASKDENEASFYTKKVLGHMKCPDDVMIGVEWLKAGETGIPFFNISQEDRWTILKAYSELTTDAKELVNAEAAKDASDTGAYGKIYCENAYPENKAEKWEAILEKGSRRELSNYEQLEAFTGWKRPSQKEILTPLAGLFFEKFNWVLENCDKEFAVKYVMYLIPTFAGDQMAIDGLTAAIAGMPEEHKYAKRKAEDELDDMKRVMQAKQKSEEYINSKSVKVEEVKKPEPAAPVEAAKKPEEKKAETAPSAKEETKKPEEAKAEAKPAAKEETKAPKAEAKPAAEPKAEAKPATEPKAEAKPATEAQPATEEAKTEAKPAKPEEGKKKAAADAKKK